MKSRKSPSRSPGGRAASEPRQPAAKSRKEQARSVVTRRAILAAALDEFAEKGYDGASTRNIADRAGIDHTLITYHYRNKDTLWKAVAENSFELIESMWDAALPADHEFDPAERVRAEFRTFLKFCMEHSAFHHFMLRENQGPSPRLPWLVKRLLHRTMDRVVPHIKQAQAGGRIIEGDPVLVYYMLLGMTSVLSSLRGEIRLTMPRPPTDEAALQHYWEIIERAVFR